MRTLAFLCLGLLPFVGGLVFDVVVFRKIVDARASTHWPRVRGVIERAGVAERTEGVKTAYILELRYEYQVDGRSYHGARLNSIDKTYPTREAAEGARPPLTAGQAVDVYYKPADPSVAVLQTGVYFVQYFHLAMTVLVTLLGFMVLVLVVGSSLYSQQSLAERLAVIPSGDQQSAALIHQILQYGEPAAMANDSKWKIECQQCGKVLSVPTSLAGRRVKCPQCAQILRVEEPQPEEAALELLPVEEEPSPRKHSDRGADRRAEQTVASSPGGFELSREKLEVFYPNFYSPLGFLSRLGKWIYGSSPLTTAGIRRHLQLGDSRAALVISTEPLLVAAYTDERDCVVMLKFPLEFVSLYGLKRGTRLVTVNTYMQGPKKPVADMIEGPLSPGRWHNMIPYIADFLSDDDAAIAARKAAITREEWQRTAMLGVEYTQKLPGKARSGGPLESWKPCIMKLF